MHLEERRIASTEHARGDEAALVLQHGRLDLVQQVGIKRNVTPRRRGVLVTPDVLQRRRSTVLRRFTCSGYCCINTFLEFFLHLH